MSRRARAQASRPPAAPALASAWGSLAVGAVFLAVYLAWAPPVSGDKDSSEFTVVLATLGLAHPTGYALYTLLGHAFVIALHACGANWPWAANAWSALGGAVALGLWHALGARLLRREGVSPGAAAALALLPAAAFGLNPSWAAEATLAEVNSWHLAWVAGACLFTLATLEAVPARRGGAGWLARRAAAWGLIVGLGLSHHATSLLVVLPLTVALLAAAWPARARSLAPGALALVPLAAAWGYVWFRSFHPAAVQWGSLGPGLHETWNHVTAAGYRHYLGGFRPSPEQQSMLSSAVYPWLVPGLLAVALWPFAKSPWSRGARLALAATALLQTAYVLGYGVSDPTSYFLPALALGLFVLPAAAATLVPVRRLGWPLAAIAALGLGVATWSWNGVALRQRTMFVEADRFLRSMWQAVPIRRGYVLWDEDLSFRLVEYQQLGHQKPELVVVRPLLLMDAGARALFARRHGFDPLDGAPPPDDARADSPGRDREFAERIGEGINRGSPDSVILFLPREPSLRLLPKPEPPAANLGG
jgi:hypothetical protein